MPNWCHNIVTFRHKNPEELNKIAKTAETDDLFNTFVPRPKEEEDNWYDWNLVNWGTKWDASCVHVISKDSNTIKVSFDTAWSPPIAFYDVMDGLGFEVDALYYEPGMNFCGQYTEGSDDFYDIQGDSNCIKENIPEEIEEAFGIVDMALEMEFYANEE
jgi:hypothetical protein